MIWSTIRSILFVAAVAGLTVWAWRELHTSPNGRPPAPWSIIR